jgi:hypothetical protein
MLACFYDGAKLPFGFIIEAYENHSKSKVVPVLVTWIADRVKFLNYSVKLILTFVIKRSFLTFDRRQLAYQCPSTAANALAF